MTNFTGSILEQNYNLTKLITSSNESIIGNPPLWLGNFNNEMGGIVLTVLLYVFGVILFLVVRRRDEVKDSEALLFAGFMTTIIGVLAFVIDTGLETKLISWPALLPIIIITAFAVILNYINRNY